MVNPYGGRPAKEYLLSMDMAKQLSMIERNEKGKQARRYFIECEKRLRNMPTAPAIDFSDRLPRPSFTSRPQRAAALRSPR